ncbi:putative phosphatidate phosphatase LPIN [Monocercomonoides exilis]|uniref:putative phosphatidate phosphatase LPIN n=1 Tax=Monocercomonoides exilis TaxID=2049356 RepID=UPI00355A1F72|nr:putative phosphatidate phosphatase LPIN [Monocercomonoides exilis]|eukprot:MONOS_5477.1-p1 / transcript=MONOS_5477.1 / gene=MONOS_5477 / organism=Monocercomonoides_exilis_PA203 / gene_product=phosphatidate phosphatase LPIN [EC:3.1.3.4] / transcript_product=phosphatidate phosphatase LPIN [EC:3.1.3.4] / location=Mono_scaffold00160:5141-8735(+) / protein_length=1180 / sequence_SO=supercontig / SO=protein_coding / is_pseudo=false
MKKLNHNILNGAADIIVVKGEDGLFRSTSFSVRFGVLKAARTHNRTVKVYVNDLKTDLEMHLSYEGLAYFLTPINPVNMKKQDYQKVDPLFDEATREVILKLTNPSASAAISTDCQITLNPSISTPELDPYFPLPPVPSCTSNQSSNLNSLRKTRFPSHSQLFQLPLHYGYNKITFTVDPYYKQLEEEPHKLSTVITSSLFLFSPWSRIVVSDVDGTVTRSDLMGHIFPSFGVSWAQKGIAMLYSQIFERGYDVIYLSSRGIGLANRTKKYLKSIQQVVKEQKVLSQLTSLPPQKSVRYSMPVGPVLLSPMSLYSSLRLEVFQRRPDLFKIMCLREVQDCFPSEFGHLYAAFGNRATDTVSYMSVGIPERRVFLLDKQGTMWAGNKHYESILYAMGQRIAEHEKQTVLVREADKIKKRKKWNKWQSNMERIEVIESSQSKSLSDATVESKKANAKEVKDEDTNSKSDKKSVDKDISDGKKKAEAFSFIRSTQQMFNTLRNKSYNYFYAHTPKFESSTISAEPQEIKDPEMHRQEEPLKGLLSPLALSPRVERRKRKGIMEHPQHPELSSIFNDDDEYEGEEEYSTSHLSEITSAFMDAFPQKQKKKSADIKRICSDDEISEMLLQNSIRTAISSRFRNSGFLLLRGDILDEAFPQVANPRTEEANLLRLRAKEQSIHGICDPPPEERVGAERTSPNGVSDYFNDYYWWDTINSSGLNTASLTVKAIDEESERKERDAKRAEYMKSTVRKPRSLSRGRANSLGEDVLGKKRKADLSADNSSVHSISSLEITEIEQPKKKKGKHAKSNSVASVNMPLLPVGAVGFSARCFFQTPIPKQPGSICGFDRWTQTECGYPPISKDTLQWEPVIRAMTASLPRNRKLTRSALFDADSDDATLQTDHFVRSSSFSLAHPNDVGVGNHYWNPASPMYCPDSPLAVLPDPFSSTLAHSQFPRLTSSSIFRSSSASSLTTYYANLPASSVFSACTSSASCASSYALSSPLSYTSRYNISSLPLFLFNTLLHSTFTPPFFYSSLGSEISLSSFLHLPPANPLPLRPGPIFTLDHLCSFSSCPPPLLPWVVSAAREFRISADGSKTMFDEQKERIAFISDKLNIPHVERQSTAVTRMMSSRAFLQSQSLLNPPVPSPYFTASSFSVFPPLHSYGVTVHNSRAVWNSVIIDGK